MIGAEESSTAAPRAGTEAPEPTAKVKTKSNARHLVNKECRMEAMVRPLAVGDKEDFKRGKERAVNYYN